MSNHTGAVGACQPPIDGTTPKTSPPPADRRLVARYGAAALGAGYAAIPHVVMKHRRGLGVTAAEWDYICELWSYWRSAALPAPSVEALARGLGVDQSTIRRYRAGLESKGLLRIVPGGPHNRYDLRPLIDAAVGLDRLQGAPDDSDTGSRAAAAPSEPGPRNSPPDDRAESHAHKEVEDRFDSDSIPPYPPLCANARSHADARHDHTEDTDDCVLADTLGALSGELGDDAPASSLTRARNLCRDADVSLNQFLSLLDEAATRTRAREEHIVKRRQRDDHAPNGMPYLFAILQDLLHPAPPRMAYVMQRPHDAGSRQRDAGRSRCQRDNRRPDRGNAWSVWSDSPERLPITEGNAVWAAVLEELAVVLTVENFNTWLATTRTLVQEGDVLRVAVPAHFNKDWLEAKLQGKVTHALQRLDYEQLGIDGERVTRVEYVVMAACAGSTGEVRAS